MQKRKNPARSQPRRGQLSATQQKFIREFSRETALAATQIWEAMQDRIAQDLMMPPPEEVTRDERGRFVRRR
jgi:hypothetical protein